ncbi:LLM class flavin-dependent oxidoreductase [Streptomyces sp. NPDC001880]
MTDCAAAGWNVVTASDTWTGGSFRRGGYLPHADRYRRPSSPTVQAGDSEQGREFAASHADVVHSRHLGTADQAFTADIRNRVARRGRDPEQVRVMPGVSFASATPTRRPTTTRAAQAQAVSPELAIWYLEGPGALAVRPRPRRAAAHRRTRPRAGTG